MPNQLNLLGTRLETYSREEILTTIDQASPEKLVRLATVNPEFLLEAEHNTSFRQALERMQCIIDGTGTYWMLKLRYLFRNKEIELYHGSDLVAELFKKYSDGQKSFYLIGGPPGLAHKAARNIHKKYPHLRFMGAGDGGRVNLPDIKLDPLLIRELKQAKPDILLAGFGAPKQELWIQAVAAQIDIPVMIGVGGSFHFYTDRKRAPKAVSKLHLEWFYRALTEKGHAKRAFRAVIVFSFHSFIWMLTHRQSAELKDIAQTKSTR